MEKDIQSILITTEQIQSKVTELARQVSQDYVGKDPVFIGVLKGCVVFFGDFIQKISIPCEIDFLGLSSYAGTQSTGQMQVRHDISTDIRGRHVVIVEDIFDTGRSLHFTYHHLLEKGPASIQIVTLLDKPSRRDPKVTLQAQYTGYQIPNEFVVGYGMDYKENYRNLPYIGIMKPEVYM